ncbi:MAG: hypothetical protein HC929_06050 [Leptolyngbyaceae cyanobacterium SM2_5_2]|nr:hypothetical protein [Leptolyngbyaceae cyanobacterium SM2_5_2]
MGLSLLLAMAACTQVPESNHSSDSVSTEPSPELVEGSTANDAEHQELADAMLALSGDGLQFVVDDATGSTRSFSFGSEMAPVQAGVTKIYGQPQESVLNSECPSGRLTITTWANGLSLTATEEEFVGWSVRPNTDSASLTTISGIGLGSTLAELEDVYSVEIFESSLGVEFYAGQLVGLLTSTQPNAVISDLWAGEVCIFR